LALPAKGFYINPSEGPPRALGRPRGLSRTPPGGPGTRSPGSPGIPDPGVARPQGQGRPRTPSRGPGGSRTRPGGPGEGGFTSTPRAGAPRFPGVRTPVPGSRRVPEGSPGRPREPPPQGGVPATPRRNRGAGVGPRRGSEGVPPLPPGEGRLPLGSPSGARLGSCKENKHYDRGSSKTTKYMEFTVIASRIPFTSCPARSPAPGTPPGLSGDSAPYPFQGGTPSGTAGPRREGLM